MILSGMVEAVAGADAIRVALEEKQARQEEEERVLEDEGLRRREAARAIQSSMFKQKQEDADRQEHLARMERAKSLTVLLSARSLDRQKERESKRKITEDRLAKLEV